MSVCCRKKYTYALARDSYLYKFKNDDKKFDNHIKVDGFQGYALNLGTKFLICAYSKGLIHTISRSMFRLLKVMPVPLPIGKTNITDNQ